MASREVTGYSMGKCQPNINFGTIMSQFLLCLLALSGVLAEELSDFTVLYPYADFSTTSLFKHDIPEATRHAVWSFQAENRYPKSCDHKNVTIVLQHGSLPLINPLGEKVPKNFYLEKESGTKVIFSLLTDNSTLVARVSYPKSGPWYGAAYLPESDGKIRPADLFVRCVYRLRNWFSIEAETEILDVNTRGVNQLELPSQGRQLYRFFVPLQTYQFSISVHNCSHGNSSTCPVSIATRGGGLPGLGNTSVRSDCTGDSCDVSVLKAEPGIWNYLEVRSKADSFLTAQLKIEFSECTLKEKYGTEDQPTCEISPLLDKFKFNSKFHSKFAYINGSHLERLVMMVTPNMSRVVPFLIEDGKENGGSLVVQGSLQGIHSLGDSRIKVQTDLCIARGSIPEYEDITTCSTGYHGNMTTTEDQRSFKVIVPYPRAGYWFVGMIMRCYETSETDASEVHYQPCGDVSVNVNVTITTNACVEGGCSKHGRCINFLNSHVLFTTCRCDAGWRGYDCSDGSEVETDTDQLLELLLLTLSNVVFLPAIVLAAYRRHYVEALVYAYNMFLSAFYHGCDGDRREEFTWCPLPISVLGVCDFLASATSIWITLVAMARPPLQWKAFLQLLGPLGILIGVLYRRTSAYLFLIPFGIGCLLLIVSWVCRCCYRHKCYPSKLKYVVCLVPGWLLAAGGLAIFTFLEDKDNYLYTHSAWHACMALSVCLLLPPRDSRVYKVKNSNGTALGSTYQPIRTNEGSNYVI